MKISHLTGRPVIRPIRSEAEARSDDAPSFGFLYMYKTDLRALPDFALKGDRSVMEQDAVLHNGEAQSRTAHISGMTLVYSVEPFEDALLIFFRNTDAVIFYGEVHGIVVVFDTDPHQPPGPAVFHCVIRQVCDDGGQKGRIAFHDSVFAVRHDFDISL